MISCLVQLLSYTIGCELVGISPKLDDVSYSVELAAVLDGDLLLGAAAA